MNASALFDAMERLGDLAQISRDYRTATTALNNVMRQCGNCALWMTRECGREAHNNKTGQYSGPSCQAIACGAFTPTAFAHQQVAMLTARLAELKARLDATTKVAP